MTFQPDRRKFLGASLALPLLHSLSLAQDEGEPASVVAPSPKKMLVLGGTKFLGPAIVEAAVRAGYEVTLFNRGRTNPSLFPELEKLRGDRDKGDLGALEGRQWDFVVDTSGYVPSHVGDVAALLADNVGHYVFVSTLSVYSESSEIIDEASEVLTTDEEKLAEVKEIGDVFKRGYDLYGPLKALCEDAAERAMPGRTTSLRAGLIVGPDDGSDRFTYWPVRVNRGGNVLAPGDPNAGVQFIDVRDLGEFAVECGASEESGVFNAVGFEGRLTMQELLHGAKIVTGSDTSFTWVDDEFLLSKKVGIYMELPLWIPSSMKSEYSNTAARAVGLRLRPVGDTIAATLAWHESRRPEGYDFPGAGMTREREQALLQEWAAQAEKRGGDGPDSE